MCLWGCCLSDMFLVRLAIRVSVGMLFELCVSC